MSGSVMERVERGVWGWEVNDWEAKCSPREPALQPQQAWTWHSLAPDAATTRRAEQQNTPHTKTEASNKPRSTQKTLSQHRHIGPPWTKEPEPPAPANQSNKQTRERCRSSKPEGATERPQPAPQRGCIHRSHQHLGQPGKYDRAKPSRSSPRANATATATPPILPYVCRDMVKTTNPAHTSHQEPPSRKAKPTPVKVKKPNATKRSDACPAAPTHDPTESPPPHQSTPYSEGKNTAKSTQTKIRAQSPRLQHHEENPSASKPENTCPTPIHQLRENPHRSPEKAESPQCQNQNTLQHPHMTARAALHRTTTIPPQHVIQRREESSKEHPKQKLSTKPTLCKCIPTSLLKVMSPRESAPLRKEDPQNQTQKHMPDTHTPARSSPARKSTPKPTKGREPAEPKPKPTEKPRPLRPENNSSQVVRPNHADSSDPSSR
ncbi:hypothetical protein CRENBAI_004339 [Crenichthys baileyi]|uniref:Uncharacterized protein n=1 Tax=Crenichthys baileyi TaxID=28760 RepID=A0AAV9SPB8_9TELE